MNQHLTTDQAAERLQLSRAQVQRLCREYQATGQGLACDKVGTGRHALYLVHPEAVAAYRITEHKPGWRKGRKRKPDDSYDVIRS